MINFAVYLQLKEKLRGVSALTYSLKRGAGEYARAASNFLIALQLYADEQRLDISSDIAVQLQKLTLYDGKDEKINRLKARDNYAARCIEEVQAVVKEFIQKNEKVFDECISACRQIAAQFVSYGQKTDADGVIAAMCSTEQLKPYYAQLVGMVGAFNLRAVMQYVLPQTGS